MEWFDRGKMVVLRLTDIGIALLALGIILQLLFGNAMPFLGNDIAANIMTFIKGLGGQGLAAGELFNQSLQHRARIAEAGSKREGSRWKSGRGLASRRPSD